MPKEVPLGPEQLELSAREQNSDGAQLQSKQPLDASHTSSEFEPISVTSSRATSTLPLLSSSRRHQRSRSTPPAEEPRTPESQHFYRPPSAPPTAATQAETTGSERSDPDGSDDTSGQEIQPPTTTKTSTIDRIIQTTANYIPPDLFLSTAGPIAGTTGAALAFTSGRIDNGPLKYVSGTTLAITFALRAVLAAHERGRLNELEQQVEAQVNALSHPKTSKSIEIYRLCRELLGPTSFFSASIKAPPVLVMTLLSTATLVALFEEGRTIHELGNKYNEVKQQIDTLIEDITTLLTARLMEENPRIAEATLKQQIIQTIKGQTTKQTGSWKPTAYKIAAGVSGILSIAAGLLAAPFSQREEEANPLLNIPAMATIPLVFTTLRCLHLARYNEVEQSQFSLESMLNLKTILETSQIGVTETDLITALEGNLSSIAEQLAQKNKDNPPPSQTREANEKALSILGRLCCGGAVAGRSMLAFAENQQPGLLATVPALIASILIAAEMNLDQALLNKRIKHQKKAHQTYSRPSSPETVRPAPAGQAVERRELSFSPAETPSSSPPNPRLDSIEARLTNLERIEKMRDSRV